MIKVNSFVVFKNPTPDEMLCDEPLRFIVTELNGDRCFIEPVTSSLHYKPIILARVAELTDEIPQHKTK